MGHAANFHIASCFQARKPGSLNDFTVAIFCALSHEADAVAAFFHTRWSIECFQRPEGDKNTYTLGAIGKLNVVLVHLPGMGKGDAAAAATWCSRSFPRIELALVVGICGGVPFSSKEDTERVIGDIVISEDLVEYDLGKQYPGEFIPKNKADNKCSISNAEVRNFLTILKGQQALDKLRNATWSYLKTLQSGKALKEGAAYPGADLNNLFEPSWIHKHRDLDECETCALDDSACEEARGSNCEKLRCDNGRRVFRARLQGLAPIDAKPWVHIGLLGSGDRVMKSGQDRDRVASGKNLMGFEMEGAGVRGAFGEKCVVIKAVCDYSDSHKSKFWQKYAAATAGLCMAAFLDQWERREA